LLALDLSLIGRDGCFEVRRGGVELCALFAISFGAFLRFKANLGFELFFLRCMSSREAR